MSSHGAPQVRRISHTVSFIPYLSKDLFPYTHENSTERILGPHPNIPHGCGCVLTRSAQQTHWNDDDEKLAIVDSPSRPWFLLAASRTRWSTAPTTTVSARSIQPSSTGCGSRSDEPLDGPSGYRPGGIVQTHTPLPSDCGFRNTRPTQSTNQTLFECISSSTPTAHPRQQQSLFSSIRCRRR